MDLLRSIDFGTIAIQFAVLLFSLSLHEAAHGWMADRFGDYTARSLGRVTLNPIPHIDPVGTVLFPLLQFFTRLPLIGWAKPVPVNSALLRNPRKDQIYVSLAGPASNLLAGCVAFAILIALKLSWPESRGFITNMAVTGRIPAQESFVAPVVGILFFALIINVALALFNALPIPPLDGHWILYGLLPPNAARALARWSSYGFLLLYAMMLLGLFQFVFIPTIWVRYILAVL